MKSNLLQALWVLFFSLLFGGSALLVTYEPTITIESLKEQR